MKGEKAMINWLRNLIMASRLFVDFGLLPLVMDEPVLIPIVGDRSTSVR